MKRTIPRKAYAGLALLLALAQPDLIWGQAPVFNYPSFSSTAEICLQGRALLFGDRIRLTPASLGQAGGVWFGTRRFVAAGFETTFEFQISGRNSGPGQTGGDGFAFVIQNNAVPALNTTAGSLGYDGTPKSLAVEFDTHQDADHGDPDGNHVSVHTRFDLVNSTDHSASLGDATNNLPDLADGNTHTAKIVYSPSVDESPGIVAVFVDDLSNPILTVAVDLEPALGLNDGQAWFGFTATTSGVFQNHDILSWSFVITPTPLTVDLIGPADGASYVSPGEVDLLADASSADGTVTLVEFFQGTRKLGETNMPPFELTWDNVAPGTYWITAVATDDSGRVSASPPIKVIVYPAAPSIGINFSTGANGASFPLGATDKAGIVAQRFWNNVAAGTNGNGSALNLRNAVNAPTSLDVNFDFFTTADEPTINLNVSPDHALMKAYGADHAGTSGGQTNSTITLQQIPFAIYDVLIYSDGANGGADRVAEFRAASSSLFSRDAPWVSFCGVYAEAASGADLGSDTATGNCVRFYGLTNSSLTITVTARSTSDGVRRAAVNALQIVPSVYNLSLPPGLVRGPYLQMGTPTSMRVRWRTSRPVNSVVRYGTDLASLTLTNEDSVAVIEHEVALTDLQPNTLYYYAVGTTETNLAGGPNHYFITTPSGARPTRVWALGDVGTAGDNPSDPRARSVRDAYENFAAGRYTDVWLLLGDNAYNSGTDGEYQNAIFNIFTNQLRTTPVWSTVGNHETVQSHTYNANIPYYQIFSLPRNGEAGGVPSGTERYYSFDHGNIHFVCLDAMTSERTPGSPMYTWLESDLMANTNEWIIAFWHHPPYTKGSHDSDNNGVDFELVEMRENIVPLLEAYGVDLVLSGHSHCYERSYLLHGHYGYSGTFVPEMKVDPGSGRPDDTGPYRKAATGPDAGKGAVYIVAGCSGQATFGSLDHPAMFYSVLQLGSVVLDINGNTLEAKFLRETGVVEDYFTLIKDASVIAFRVKSLSIANDTLALTWHSEPGKTYYVERATNMTAPDWTVVSSGILATNGVSAWSQPWVGSPSESYYRIKEGGE